MPEAGAPIYADLSFSSRGDVAPRLVERALSLLPGKRGLNLLDLGCGSGAVAVTAASTRPDLQAVALDISAVNVAAAKAAAESEGVGARVCAVCADYLTWSGARFNIIVSDSVLHLIPGDDASLAARLASDLVPGGVLIATMAVESAGNSVRLLMRRSWRVLPTAADRFALAVARRLHPEFSAGALADRITYLRILPSRLFGPQLVAVFERHGLQLIEDTAWDSPSALKLDHRLLVWRRR